MSGFIRLHRTVFKHPLLKDAERFKAWLWMVSEACWKPQPFDIQGKTVTLQRGQFCAPVRTLADEWGWSKSAVDRFLTRLESETMIVREAGHGKLVITICNYDKYQHCDDGERDSSGTASGTAAGQQRDLKEEGKKGIIEEPEGSSHGRADERQQVVDCWNAMAKAHGLSACRLTEKRSRALTARLKRDGLDAIRQAIERIPKSSFLLGTKPNSQWRADIEFLLRPDSVTRILEGKYDDRPAASTGNSSDGLVVALRRRLDAHDAEEFAGEPDRRAVQPGEGHRQGALALPGPDR